MNQQEDETDYQPNDWQGVEDALEDGFQFSVLSSSLVAGRWQPA
jgi:hypothetical protein